jgi:endonuclease YncB( thermonuclease family)
LEQLTATSPRKRMIERRAWAAGLLSLLMLVPDSAEAASRRTAASRAALAKAPQCPSEGTRGVVFGKALDGSSFVTADGTEIRLAGVLSPGEGGETLSAGQADAARATLAALLRSGPLMLAGDEGPRDRYGRVHAQVFAGGASVQSALLRAGEVRVAPDRASALCDPEFISAESEARAQKNGHWRDGLFALRAPEQLDNRTGTFQIVEGTVTTATLYKGRAYINFGTDYRKDFTVTVSPQDMKLFREKRIDVRKLAGQHVRVRGWLELYNGPEMEIANPTAIERLD